MLEDLIIIDYKAKIIYNSPPRKDLEEAVLIEIYQKACEKRVVSIGERFNPLYKTARIGGQRLEFDPSQLASLMRDRIIISDN